MPQITEEKEVSRGERGGQGDRETIPGVNPGPPVSLAGCLMEPPSKPRSKMTLRIAVVRSLWSPADLTAWPEPHTEMTAHSVGDLFQNVAGPAAPEASPGGRSQQSSLVPEPMFSLWLRNRKLPPGCVTLPGAGTPTLSSLPPRTDPLSSPPCPPSLFFSLRLFSPKCKCHSSCPQWVY